MVSIKFRPVCAALVLALALVFVVPGMAIASLEEPAGHHSGACQEQPAVPLCCVTADCPIYQCILNEANNSTALRSIRPAQKEDICPVAALPVAGTEITKDLKIPCRPEAVPESPPGISFKHHCRNSLASEDPFSL
jgi:hypothetical protein